MLVGIDDHDEDDCDGLEWGAQEVENKKGCSRGDEDGASCCGECVNGGGGWVACCECRCQYCQATGKPSPFPLPRSLLSFIFSSTFLICSPHGEGDVDAE